MDREFPEGYPVNLLTLIIEDGAEDKAINVFRVCRTGKVNRDAFLSTFQDAQKKASNNTNENTTIVNRDVAIFDTSKIDIGDFSTSCFDDLMPVRRIINNMQKSTPQQIIAKGITSPDCGLSMKTLNSKSKRSKRRNDPHVDWWIYKDATPEIYFKEYLEEKEADKQ